jgi:hypothetical protein
MVPQVKEAIHRYVAKYEEFQEDLLTIDDWDTLSIIKDFLQNLDDATLASEGYNSTLETVLPSMDFILDSFEKGKEQYAQHPFLGPCFNSGWAKMDQYYTLTGETPVYVAVLVLDPRKKWYYFEDSWAQYPDWISEAKKKVQQFWEQQYKSKETATREVVQESQEPKQRKLNTFQAWEQSKKRPRVLGDEYTRYINAEIIDDISDPRAWWQEHTQQLNYPNLSVMALDLLSIPAMSAEPERLFSAAKISITDRRNRLGIQSIEALECLKSWLGLRPFDWESMY